jgi:hypothetical protein
MNNELRFVIFSLLCSWVGIFGVTKVQQRADIGKAGFWVGLVYLVVVVGFGFISGDAFVETAKFALIGSIGNGIISTIITIGGLFFLEKPFGIASSIQLLELANPHESILKRLMMETPGTYNHTIYVANLSEAAATEVGANPLLVRVGSYYHDIGKIKRPYFFIENQIKIDNLHEHISPSLSALIIKSHVSDGVEMAKEYGLPQIIIDFICEHHGTNLISYFYQQAVNDKDESSNQDAFRYDGPKPQTKETAIVMLADAVEAAVRAISEPNSDNIQSMVKKVLKNKLEDGQLDECDLTFKELNKIVQAFIRLLEGMFHPRVEYPEGVKEHTESVKEK